MCATTTELFPLRIPPQLLNLAIRVSVLLLIAIVFHFSAIQIHSGYASSIEISSIFFRYSVPAQLPGIGKSED